MAGENEEEEGRWHAVRDQTRAEPDLRGEP